MSSITRRIEREAGIDGLADILADRLSPTDLQSLMLEVYRRRAARRTPASVLADYRRSRFARPAATDARALAAFAAVALDCIGDRFEPVELSPIAPLGACSAVADVSQDWSIPAVRTGEIVSDCTNVLALEAAVRHSSGTTDVHLAAIQRVVRPQAYSSPNALAHFTLFALVSSGRDRGGFGWEAEAIAAQTGVYLDAFRRWFGDRWHLGITYTRRTDTYAANDARIAALAGVASRFGASLGEDPDRQAARSYYDGFCLHILGGPTTDTLSQLTDLGTVDWGARITGNAKMRMVVSGVGVDRLVALRAM